MFLMVRRLETQKPKVLVHGSVSGCLGLDSNPGLIASKIISFLHSTVYLTG